MMKNTGKESITDQINNLRNWIVKTFQVHPGCILFTTVDERAFTFMMNEKHVNTLLDYVKTDDGQICLSRKGVEQIIQDKNVFEIGKIEVFNKNLINFFVNVDNYLRHYL